MAPEIDDHIIMSTFSQPVAQVVKESWKEGCIMYGMSPFNRGGTVFLNNIVADVVPALASRKRWDVDPTYSQVKEMDAAIQSFVNLYEDKFTYIKIDFSRYDSKIVSEVGSAAMRSFQNMYDLDTKRRRRRLGRVFDYMERAIVNTQICMPDGQVWRKGIGNVSGSPFTTLYNSWTDGLFMWTAISFLLEGKVDPRITLRVHGDDNIVVVPKALSKIVNLENLVEVLEGGMHLKVNVAESGECSKLVYEYGENVEDVVSFLGRRYMRDGMAFRPLDVTLEHMVHPDSDDMSPNGALSRLNGLLIDNPFNEEAVWWLVRCMDRLEEMGAQLDAPSLTEVRKYVHGFGMSMETFARLTRVSSLQARDMYCLTAWQRQMFPTYVEGPLDYTARLSGIPGPFSSNWEDSRKSETFLDDMDMPTRRMGRSARQTMGATEEDAVAEYRKQRNVVRFGRRTRRRAGV